MNIQIRSVADKGVAKQERLVLRVLVDSDLGDYVMLQTGFNEKTKHVTAHVYHAFWFPDKIVAAGDLVVLYTKDGNNSEKQIEGGKITHFFYWGLTGAIWASQSKASVLLHAPAWESKKPGEF